METAARSARSPSPVITPRAECDGGLVLLVLFVSNKSTLGVLSFLFLLYEGGKSDETLNE